MGRCETAEFIRLGGFPYQIGRCVAQATRFMRMGCKHEHVESARVCGLHESATRQGGLAICAPCMRDPDRHECAVMFISSEPLKETAT